MSLSGKLSGIGGMTGSMSNATSRPSPPIPPTPPTPVESESASPLNMMIGAGMDVAITGEDIVYTEVTF